jgi:hypothetical protein
MLRSPYETPSVASGDLRLLRVSGAGPGSGAMAGRTGASPCDRGTFLLTLRVGDRRIFPLKLRL